LSVHLKRDRQECLSYKCMKDQSHPKGFFGPHLLAGVIVFAAMTLALGEISENIRNGEPMTVVDAQLSSWPHSHRSPVLTQVMFVVTFLGSGAAASLIAGLFGLYLLWRRRFYWLAAFLLSVVGGILLNRILKYAFQRPRPHFVDPILSLTSYSFPSGHTMTATVLFGVLAAYFAAATSDPRYRALIFLSAALLILLVAFSRIYLGAHYLGDVLGAIAEGTAWLALCLTAVHSIWRQRNVA
jgi:membrane-associated phospholipid phosphatase